MAKFSRSSYISAKSTHIFIKLYTYAPTNHPKLSNLGDLPPMAPFGLGEYPNFEDLHIFLPNQLGSFWNLKLKLLGTNQSPKVVDKSLPISIAPLGHGKYPNFQNVFICLPNRLRTLWNSQLDFLWYQPNTPSWGISQFVRSLYINVKLTLIFMNIQT